MPFLALQLVLTFLLDLVQILTRSPQDQAIEVVLLRQQLRIAQRTASPAPRLSRWEKVTLATLGARCRDLANALVLVKPVTVLRWHREIVRRKWTYGNAAKRGRPPTPAATVALIVRFAGENRAWGDGKIQGELLQVGHRVSRATIKRVLRRQHLAPGPRRGSTTWRAFVAQHRAQLLACDFFTVDTLFLQRRYVLFFIELGSRRLHLAGCTAKPDGAWVTQQARNLCWRLRDRAGEPLRFLIRDRDGQFPASFDTVLASEGLAVVKTPPRAPNANAVAERVVRSIRGECLDHLLVVNEAHLRSVLAQYAAYYNHRRPHQGRDQGPPVPFTIAPARPADPAQIRCRPVLGGLINDYGVAA
jgi:putative transposase